MFFPGRTIIPVTLLTDAPSATVWSRIGTGVGAEVASGDWTAVEDAASVEGDLLVTCISYRSSAAFTLPAGWALVATQQSSGNVVVDSVSSIGSALMAYIVRGASTPAMVFTRTAGDIAIGATITYRGCTATPYDTGSANTLGTASASCTTTTITTAENNELLVALYGGARPQGATVFDAATGATTDSGAGSDNVNPPASNAWLRRRSTSTTTGADCGIAIADAVMTTAGATGTVSCTAGASARHVMILGSFKKAA